MTRTITFAAMLCVAAIGNVFANERYDRNLEKAVMKIAASRIGAVEDVMRGTFAVGERPAMTSARELGGDRTEPQESILWTDGLARAVEVEGLFAARPVAKDAKQTDLRQ